MRLPRRPLLVVLTIGLMSVVGCSTPSDEYVAADRATYDAVSPALRGDISGAKPIEQYTADERGKLEVILSAWELRTDRGPKIDYVVADRQTFNVIAPAIRGDLDGSQPIEQLPAAEQDSLITTLDTWALRLSATDPEPPVTNPTP